MNQLLKLIISKIKFFVISIVVFSFIYNALMLIMPLYSLQVLDRVLSSQSKETLLMLSILAFVIYITITIITVIRSSILLYISNWFDNSLARKVLLTNLDIAKSQANINGTQLLRDIATIKTFLTGQGLIALLDAPWAPIFLIAIFIIHPIPGFVVLVAGLVLLALAWFNEKQTEPAIQSHNQAQMDMYQFSDVTVRHSDVINSMGMHQAVAQIFDDKQEKSTNEFKASNSINNAISSTIKGIRMIIQMLTMAVAAYLALAGKMSPGSIIAISILSGKALQPFDQAVTIWKSVVGARKSFMRIEKTLSFYSEQTPIQLPTPTASVTAEKVTYTFPKQKEPKINNLNFTIEPGDIVGVTGPSAAGKTTLCKLLLGIITPTSGHIRLDNADISQWDKADIGNHVGYLPQSAELMMGTVKENIARMQKDVDDQLIIEAAQLAGVHEIILQLPNGYDTIIGPNGAPLSAGQRQRIGLARAFFGNPSFVVLDEPNSNLDNEGDVALASALAQAKERNITVVVISHRKTIFDVINKLMVLQNGAVVLYGDKNEVFEKLNANAAQPKVAVASS